MSNSFFKRFKKKETPVIEDLPPVWEDRIFWVSTLQKIAFPVLNNLAKGTLRKNMPYESSSEEGKKLADEWNAEFFETSAKEKIHIIDIFECFILLCCIP